MPRDPLPINKAADALINRGLDKDFRELLVPDGDCLLFRGLDVPEYPSFHGIKTHRLALYLATGQQAHRVSETEVLYTLHSCGRKCCCSPRHLSLGSHAENIRQAWKQANMQRRLSHREAMATITLRNSGMSVAEIADQMGVTREQVSQILHGKRHIFRFAGDPVLVSRPYEPKPIPLIFQGD